MKQARKIGLFDSGVGGLTVLLELMKMCPNDEIIYYGDTARVPYGDKSPQTIQRYASESAHFLYSQGVDALVIACNTASALAYTTLSPTFSIPVIDVIDPAVCVASSKTHNKKIAVIGTKATIRSGVYQHKIQSLDKEIEVLGVPCPLLVPLIEERYFNSMVIEQVVSDYLLPIQKFGADTLILGCTHYPVLSSLIEKIMGSEVTVINSALATVNQLVEVLGSGYQGSKGSCRYIVSDDPESFRSAGRQLFGLEIDEVELYTKIYLYGVGV